MAGTNILVRQKDLIAGAGISITPDTTSGNVTIAATNTAIDEARLLPENAEANNLVIKRVGDTGIDGNTYLMLHFDEESGAPVDSSQSGLSVTANSTTTTTVGKFNRALNLNNSYLSLTCPAMATGTGDFTYEGWFYFNELNKRRGLFGVDMGLYVALWGDNTYGVAISTSGSSWNYNHMDYSRSEATATQGVWQHIALVRHGATVTLYLNGNSILSFDIGADTVITGNMGNNPFRIGYPLGGMSYVADFVDEFRFSTVARWTENFTPPEKAYSTSAESWDPISMEGLRDELSAVGAVAVSNPANGDIPCYSDEPPEGVNYNDANTVLLLQGSSDNTAAAPTAERLNGIVTGEFPVQADGSILVNGTSNYITFNDADARRVFSGEFTLETYIKTTQFTASGKRQDTNWCVVYRNDTSSVTAYQWLLLSDFFANAGKFGIWPYPQMSGETFPKTLVNAEFQHVAIDVYMVDGVRKFTMYRNGVPYHTGNYWSTTPADWSSDISAAMRLFGGGPSGGDDYLSNASVMSLRVSNVARYKGVSFDPPADGKYLTPPAGYWGKLNKSLLAQKSDVLPEWHQLSASSAITLDRANGELQKVTLTQNCTLTAPVLDADHPTLLLQVTSSSAVTVTVGETQIWSGSGTFQVGWYWDGEATRRYPAVEVA